MQKLGYIEAADYLEEVLLVFCNLANNKCLGLRIQFLPMELASMVLVLSPN